jgi:hypothetical protein
VEQFSYGPFAMVSFFFGMSLLEGKSCDEGANEVRAKFWPTLQVSMTLTLWQNHIQNRKWNDKL